MARFRASMLRRASAVGWAVLIAISYQAVRSEVFTDPGFWVPMAGLAALLAASTVVRWDRAMASGAAIWVSAGWLIGFIAGVTALAVIPELTGITRPVLIGIAAVSGLVITWWAHALVTVLIGVAIGGVAFALGEADAIIDLAAPLITVATVAGATALAGLEFEREAVRSMEREEQIDEQRLDFERLYAVSATLARAESLSEIVPHLVGTICKYLDAQVGVVLLYDPDHHRLEIMSPIWVNGYPVDADPLVIEVSGPGVVPQTFKAGKPILVKEVSTDTDAHTLLRDLGIRQALVAPLKVESLRVGVIIIGDPYEGSFREDQLEQLGSLSAPAALVLSQIGRYEAQAEMTKKLEEVAQMKTDFVSTVSHELRTPLTSIIGSLDTVNRPELAPTQPAAQQLLTTARNSAGRLQRLIDDLLVVSRIDRGAIPVHIGPVEVKTLLDEVARMVSIDPSITVEPENTVVEADRDHLNRIMINLVENAAKYAPGSPVEVYAWERGHRVVMAVVDHGDGIPDNQKERIFERFTQMDQSDTRSRGGTGLGLSIVKSLTEVMRGSVHVEDTEGGGATFVVDLPLATMMEMTN